MADCPRVQPSWLGAVTRRSSRREPPKLPSWSPMARRSIWITGRVPNCRAKMSKGTEPWSRRRRCTNTIRWPVSLPSKKTAWSVCRGKCGRMWPDQHVRYIFKSFLVCWPLPNLRGFPKTRKTMLILSFGNSNTTGGSLLTGFTSGSIARNNAAKNEQRRPRLRKIKSAHPSVVQ